MLTLSQDVFGMAWLSVAKIVGQAKILSILITLLGVCLFLQALCCLASARPALAKILAS